MGNFREHGVLLYLDKTLYKAFIKLQADKNLGRSYAGLLPFVEGLYQLGYLSKKEYEKRVRKYSKSLDEMEKENEPLTKEQLEKEKKLKDLEKQFSMVIEQWDLHPSLEWRLRWVKKAKEWKDKIPSAKALLDLADKEVVSNE